MRDKSVAASVTTGANCPMQQDQLDREAAEVARTDTSSIGKGSPLCGNRHNRPREDNREIHRDNPSDSRHRV